MTDARGPACLEPVPHEAHGLTVVGSQTADLGQRETAALEPFLFQRVSRLLIQTCRDDLDKQLVRPDSRGEQTAQANQFQHGGGAAKAEIEGEDRSALQRGMYLGC